MSSHQEQRVQEEAEERLAPPGEVVYEAILQEGQHELERKSRALAWSGLGAGLSMGFSLVAEALLRLHLPEARWTPLVAKAGYAVGFVIVILGRQQLFTKDTLTAILPLLRAGAPRRELRNVGRLWAIVLGTNLVGAICFAWLLAHTPTFGAPAREMFGRVAAELPLSSGFLAVACRAVAAGWLIAMMIWLLPFAETARIWVIVILAYLVGLGGFPHIIAATVETSYAVLTGALTPAAWLVKFFLPTLLGNVVGGVALVAVGAHAEFIQERREHTGKAGKKTRTGGRS
jgi:formate/nitrite transporter FocA (FNT family)